MKALWRAAVLVACLGLVVPAVRGDAIRSEAAATDSAAVPAGRAAPGRPASGQAASGQAAPGGAAPSLSLQPDAAPQGLAGQALHGQPFSHGIFESVTLYRPRGQPNGIVLLLSGDRGWDAQGERLAQVLAARGALVAGIGTPAIYRSQAADGCIFPSGDLDNLARNIQAYLRLPNVHVPLLAGYGEGAALAYAVHAQAPSDTFAGALTLDFCPWLNAPKPLCEGAGVHFDPVRGHGGFALLAAPSPGPGPWLALQHEGICGQDGTVERFTAQVPGARLMSLRHALAPVGIDDVVLANWVRAYARLQGGAAAPAGLPGELADLPVVEVPFSPAAQACNCCAAGCCAHGAAPQAAAGVCDTLAILISGDGGWAGFDARLANALGAAGVPVVGVDALRYFWARRTPDGLAADVDRLIRYYREHWGRQRVVLIGFSQGADVLPFALNRLPQASRAAIARAVLLSPGRLAAFEFHVGNWLGPSDDGLPIAPEMAALPPGMALCVYGRQDRDSICPTLGRRNVPVLAQPGGHHFDDDAARLAGVILQATGVDAATAPVPQGPAQP